MRCCLWPTLSSARAKILYLTARLLEEARWGLNWVLKTRFGDGYRSTGQIVSYWTDGIMGTADDRFGKAVNDPEWNFRVTTVEALAARVFKDSDPELATRSLATAEEDWKYAVEGLKTAAPLPEVYGASDELERISYRSRGIRRTLPGNRGTAIRR